MTNKCYGLPKFIQESIEQALLDCYNVGIAEGVKSGRAGMKGDVLAIIEPCLDRDPTLQKIKSAIVCLK